MTVNESAIINDDSPLFIPRQLARWIGLNEAAILQQLHYHTQSGHGQVITGIRWVRMSETEWLDEIPIDEKAIQRAIKNLVNDGIIQSKPLPGMGRCNWYTVNYEAVEALTAPVGRIIQKSETRKKARATNKKITESVENNEYAEVKEQNVPIQKEVVKEQNVPKWEQNVPIVKEQNVPLQDSKTQDSSRDSLLLNARMCEIYDKIGMLCKTNFSNPKIEPFKTSLIKACQDYTPEKVLWAIEVALSPEKANGRPKTWSYVLGILESDKYGGYEAKKNGARKNGSKPIKDHRPEFEKRREAGQSIDDEFTAQLRDLRGPNLAGLAGLPS